MTIYSVMRWHWMEGLVPWNWAVIWRCSISSSQVIQYEKYKAGDVTTRSWQNYEIWIAYYNYLPTLWPLCYIFLRYFAILLLSSINHPRIPPIPCPARPLIICTIYLSKHHQQQQQHLNLGPFRCRYDNDADRNGKTGLKFSMPYVHRWYEN